MVDAAALERDYRARWLVVAAMAIVAMSALCFYGVGFAVASALPVLASLGMLVALVAICQRLALIWPVGRLAADTATDIVVSLVQLVVMLQVAMPLSYIAARVGASVPLRDAVLAAIDHRVFGFDWDLAAHFVAARPALNQLLDQAYYSLRAQALILLVVGSVLRPGARNSEFIWLTMVATLLTAVVFIATPAMGKVGHLGPAYGIQLDLVRSGHWSLFSFARAEGIVTFPSFHTTMALIYVYAAGRLQPWLLWIYIPLNVAMIASSVPIGGHYLADVAGGAVVAAVSVAIVRRGVPRPRLVARLA